MSSSPRSTRPSWTLSTGTPTPAEPGTAPGHGADLALARRAVAGSVEAQRELFHQLKYKVHATIFRVLGSNAQIEDLLQEAFIDIFGSLASYRGDSLLSTWADRIAIRVVHRHFREKRALKRSGPPPPPELHLVSSSEDRMEHREGVRRLYAALAEMPPHYRIAFGLFAFGGRSLEQVADCTGVSVVAAKTRVWRARRLLEKTAMTDGVLANYLTSASI